MPFSIFASIWSYNVSSKRIVAESLIPISISIYILITGIFSPCPPLVTHYLGGYLIVVCWIVASCWFMRIRCLVSSKLEKYGEKILFISGCFTLLGQIVGGITIYLCIDVYRLLKDKDKCTPIDFCYSWLHISMSHIFYFFLLLLARNKRHLLQKGKSVPNHLLFFISFKKLKLILLCFFK